MEAIEEMRAHMNETVESKRRESVIGSVFPAFDAKAGPNSWTALIHERDALMGLVSDVLLLCQYSNR